MEWHVFFVMVLTILTAELSCCFSNRGAKDDLISTDWLIDGIPRNQLSELQGIDADSLLTTTKDNRNLDIQRPSCQIVQIVHLLNHSGCQPKAIASFACSGSCPSYVQMSASKFWQYERSCSCCQQTGLQEATFTLDCPSLNPPYKKVKTYSPVDCMCRACTDLGREKLQPQELVEALAGNSDIEERH